MGSGLRAVKTLADINLALTFFIFLFCMISQIDYTFDDSAKRVSMVVGITSLVAGFVWWIPLRILVHDISMDARRETRTHEGNE